MRIRGMFVLPIIASVACGGSDTPSGQEDGSSNASLDAGLDEASSGVRSACDPFAARHLPIAIGTVIAVGESSAGLIYAVDQVDSSQRVFVSDASGTLVRQRIAGSGTGPDFFVFDISDHDPAFVLQIDIPVGGTMRMGVFNGTLTDSKTFVIGQQGEELTVLPAEVIASTPVRNLPGDVVVEYAAALADGDIMVVTRPRDDWSYEDFRLFLGPMGAVAERKVGNVVRARDGGSTTITFDLDDSSAVASFPVVFADGGFAPGPATLTVGGNTTSLTRQGAQPAGATYLCSSGPKTFTLNDSGGSVSAKLGEELDIKLSSIGPSSYGDPVVSSSSVQYLSVSVVPPYTPGGPTQLFTFKAAAVGQATITIPKVNDPTGTLPAFTLTVNVD
jgi:hypothetical protein